MFLSGGLSTGWNAMIGLTGRLHDNMISSHPPFKLLLPGQPSLRKAENGNFSFQRLYSICGGEVVREG
jgi:hypothetical protein